MQSRQGMFKNGHFKGFMVLLIGLALLSACGTAEMEVTVYAGDRYQQEMIIRFPEEMLELSGGTSEVENMLDEMVAEAQAEDVTLKWRRLRSSQSNVVEYEIRTDRVKMTDSDIQGFTWRETAYDNRDAYRFEFPEYMEFSGNFQSFTLTLHAGRILESNGTEIDNRTVRWVNPMRMPYAIVQPRSAVTWLPLLGAGLLLMGLVAVILPLGLSGRLKKWGVAGFSTGKWRVQLLKLNNEHGRLQKTKTQRVEKLGHEAWEARVLHSSYADHYMQLEGLEKQRVELQEQVQGLEEALQQAKHSRAQVQSDYEARLGALQDEHRSAKARMDQIQADKATLENQLTKTQTERQTTQAEIDALRAKLNAAQQSTAPDREDRVATLVNAIESLERSRVQLEESIPQLQSQIAELPPQQEPLAERIADLNRQIERLQEEQRQALAPLNQQIADLQQQISTKQEQIAEITQQMKPMLDKLGPLVDQARPESAALSETYAELDELYRKLTELRQEQDLLKVRLDAVDSGAARNFYLILAGVGIALILVVGLLILGLR